MYKKYVVDNIITTVDSWYKDFWAITRTPMQWLTKWIHLYTVYAYISSWQIQNPKNCVSSQFILIKNLCTLAYQYKYDFRRAELSLWVTKLSNGYYYGIYIYDLQYTSTCKTNNDSQNGYKI